VAAKPTSSQPFSALKGREGLVCRACFDQIP
jgi:hypothetical protein